jgi:hypothetical protein
MATQAQAAAARQFGAPIPKRQKSWSLDQADKVAALARGREWYGYLSEYFSHGKVTDWRGLSWQGGVVSIHTGADEFAFLGLMSYLVEQVAFMNAAAALCPVQKDPNHWKEWVEPTLAQLRDIRKSSKTLVDAARVAATGGRGAGDRTD